MPDSPCWTGIGYRQADVTAGEKAELVNHSRRLFKRLGLRDYGRFDFRRSRDGLIKLMEANTNPPRTCDAKLALMAGFKGMSYPQMLRRNVIREDGPRALPYNPQELPTMQSSALMGAEPTRIAEWGFQVPDHPTTPLGNIARRTGVRDIFILRRVEGDRFVHVGGAGRGEGWAGLSEIRLNDNASARRAYDENRLVMSEDPSGMHVYGPYWSTWAAFAPVSHDVMVIFGGRMGNEEAIDGARLTSAAVEAAEGVEAVSPAKRLADELEILHAIQKLMATEPDTSSAAMQHIVDCATEALSCDFGAVWMERGRGYAASSRGWTPGPGPAGAIGRLRSMEQLQAPRTCVQNANDRPLEAPFSVQDGIRSYYLLPIGDHARLLLLHTSVEARGFTHLCQELGRRMADSSEILLRAALQREQLADELDKVSEEARRDPLTGIANRLAWEEHLASLESGDPQRSIGVLYIDMDNLKRINDEHGHAAGDEVIRAMAGILSSHVRPNDFVARLGGDEFAALLPDAGPEACANVVERLYTAAAHSPRLHGYPVQFRHGIAVRRTGQDMDAALRKADESLLEAKRSRRS